MNNQSVSNNISFKKLEGEVVLGEFKDVFATRALAGVQIAPLVWARIKAQYNILVTNKRIFFSGTKYNAPRMDTDETYDTCMSVFYFNGIEAKANRKKLGFWKGYFGINAGRFTTIRNITLEDKTLTIYCKGTIGANTGRKIPEAGKEIANLIKDIFPIV
jgi:hypothetical protein